MTNYIKGYEGALYLDTAEVVGVVDINIEDNTDVEDISHMNMKRSAATTTGTNPGPKNRKGASKEFAALMTGATGTFNIIKDKGATSRQDQIHSALDAYSRTADEATLVFNEAGQATGDPEIECTVIITGRANTANTTAVNKQGYAFQVTGDVDTGSKT